MALSEYPEHDGISGILAAFFRSLVKLLLILPIPLELLARIDNLQPSDFIMNL